jgi:hypothetical protein
MLCVPDAANPVSVTSTSTAWAYGTAVTVSSSFPDTGLIVGLEISTDITITVVTHCQLKLFVAGYLKAIIPFTIVVGTAAGYMGPNTILWLTYPIKVNEGDTVQVQLATGGTTGRTLAVKVVYVTFME